MVKIQRLRDAVEVVFARLEPDGQAAATAALRRWHLAGRGRRGREVPEDVSFAALLQHATNYRMLEDLERVLRACAGELPVAARRGGR